MRNYLNTTDEKKNVILQIWFTWSPLMPRLIPTSTPKVVILRHFFREISGSYILCEEQIYSQNTWNFCEKNAVKSPLLVQKIEWDAACRGLRWVKTEPSSILDLWIVRCTLMFIHKHSQIFTQTQSHWLKWAKRKESKLSKSICNRKCDFI